MKQGRCLLGFALGGTFEGYSSADIQTETEPQEAKDIEKKEGVRQSQIEKVQHFHPRPE